MSLFGSVSYPAGERATAPDGSASRILIRDTWNTEILDALAPMDGDTIVYKHRFSGFFETELHETLKAWGSTNWCSPVAP